MYPLFSVCIKEGKVRENIPWLDHFITNPPVGEVHPGPLSKIKFSFWSVDSSRLRKVYGRIGIDRSTGKVEGMNAEGKEDIK